MTERGVLITESELNEIRRAFSLASSDIHQWCRQEGQTFQPTRCGIKSSRSVEFLCKEKISKIRRISYGLRPLSAHERLQIKARQSQ